MFKMHLRYADAANHLNTLRRCERLRVNDLLRQQKGAEFIQRKFYGCRGLDLYHLVEHMRQHKNCCSINKLISTKI